MTELRKTFITDETTGDTADVNANGSLEVMPVDSSGNEGVSIIDPIDGTIAAEVVDHEGDRSLRTVPGHNPQFFIHLGDIAVGATQAFMLIDLSDTVNWPHTETGHIILEHLYITLNPSTAFRGDITLGFLTDVDATNGDLRVVHGWHFTNSADDKDIVLEHTYGRDMEMSEWFGPSSIDDVLFQTDVNLQGPDGETEFPSGDGDVVLKVAQTAGTISVGISIGYDTAP